MDAQRRLRSGRAYETASGLVARGVRRAVRRSGRIGAGSMGTPVMI